MALPGSEVKCPRPSTQNENNVTGTSDGQPAVISEYEMNIEEEIEIKPEQNIVPHDKDVGPSSLHCLKMKDEPDICHDVGSLEDKIIGHEVILPANVKEEPMDDDDEDSPCNDPLANSTHFLTGTSVDVPQPQPAPGLSRRETEWFINPVHFPKHLEPSATAKASTRKMMKRCRQCTRRSIKKKVTTICPGCTDEPGLCLECFVPWHVEQRNFKTTL
uniref:Uncharacterized protein n=3 Tax=Lygus hesperus TaxID=30085 RepID=A0A0K8SST1_LYGHE